VPNVSEQSLNSLLGVTVVVGEHGGIFVGFIIGFGGGVRAHVLDLL
jgi:hypothetical protein